MMIKSVYQSSSFSFDLVLIQSKKRLDEMCIDIRQQDWVQVQSDQYILTYFPKESQSMSSSLNPPKFASFKLKLIQNIALNAKIVSSDSQPSNLDVYILGSSDLPHYFHSKITEVPSQLASYFPSIYALFYFMKDHSQHSLGVLWPDGLGQEEVVIRLKVQIEESSQWLEWPVTKTLKRRVNLYELRSRRQFCQLRLQKKEVDILQQLADKYRDLSHILKMRTENMIPAEQAIIPGKRDPSEENIWQQNIRNRKTIKTDEENQVRAVQLKNNQRLDPSTKKEPQNGREGPLSKIRAAVQKGVIENQQRHQQHRYFWSPLLAVITLPAIPDPLPHQEGKKQLIPPNFRNSVFRSKYLIKVQEQELAVTRLPSSDRNFYHLNHHKPITGLYEYIKVTLVKIQNQDFTVGILGKDALDKPRKEWPKEIIAYVGCANSLICGLQQKKVWAIFRPGDYIYVGVDLVDRKIKFSYNSENMCQSPIPNEMPGEFYFFFQTSTPGTKVLFSFYEF